LAKNGSDLAKNGSVDPGQIDPIKAIFKPIYSGLNYLSATFRFLVKFLASLLTVSFRSVWVFTGIYLRKFTDPQVIWIFPEK